MVGGRPEPRPKLCDTNRCFTAKCFCQPPRPSKGRQWAGPIKERPVQPVMVFLVMEHSFGKDWDDKRAVAAYRSLDAAYGYKRGAEEVEATRAPIAGLEGRFYSVSYLQLGE